MAKEKELSPAQEKFLKIIEEYKKRNPVKAKMKEAEFEKKLASLA